MKVVIDLQGCQSNSSRDRGIGRYSLALAQAMVRHCSDHEFWITLNTSFRESTLALRKAFDGLVPSEHIQEFELPTDVAENNPYHLRKRYAAELARERFLCELNPDLVHV